MTNLSIIVPVYKAEQYIHECVDSILNQIYTDFELILIDDGSPDNCGRICDEYARKDNRIKVIHQKNSGVSVARNKGVEVSTGKYISFVDSDDYISPEMYSTLMDTALSSDADIIKCGYQEFDNLGLGRIRKFDRKLDYIESKEAILKCYFEGVLFVVVWNAIYKRELVQSVKYPIGLIAEDNYVSGMYLARASKVCIVDKVLYFYRYNESGLSKCQEPNDRPLDVLVCKSMLHEELICNKLVDDWFLLKLRKNITMFVYNLIKSRRFIITIDKELFRFMINNLEFRRKLKMYYYLFSKRLLLKM